jgi:hypothetical protein
MLNLNCIDELVTLGLFFKGDEANRFIRSTYVSVTFMSSLHSVFIPCVV